MYNLSTNRIYVIKGWDMDTFNKALEGSKLVKANNTYFNVDTNKDGEITICRCGGGDFVTPVKAIKNPEIFTVVDALPSDYKRGVYSLDADDTMIFEGFSVPERRWNGWAMPAFEISVAKEIIKIVNETMGDFFNLERDDERGVVIVTEKDWDQTYEVEDFVIQVDGKSIVVVDIMAANWCWDDHFGNEALEMLKRKVPYTG